MLSIVTEIAFEPENRWQLWDHWWHTYQRRMKTF